MSASSLPDPALFSTTGADALRIVLMSRHADKALHEALFRTCCAGRDVVLTSAQHLHIELRPDPDSVNRDGWQRQLDALQQALATRGLPCAGITTALTVSIDQLDSHFAVETALDSLLSFLQQAGQYISELTLQSTSFPYLLDTFLQRAGPGLCNLTSIHMSDSASALPAPSQLHSLRHLSMTRTTSDEECRNSIVAVLPQIIQLCLKPNATEQYTLPYMIQDASPLRGLVELTVLTLFDHLLESVINGCPSLRRLSTHFVELYCDYTGKQWGVQRLCVGDLTRPTLHQFQAREYMETLAMLALLPKCAAGVDGQWPRLCVEGPPPEAVPVGYTTPDKGTCLHLVIDSAEGLPEAFAARLSKWSFAVEKVIVCSGRVLRPCTLGLNEEPEALTNTLTQLRALEAPGAVVQFKDWDWYYDLADVLTEALPSLSHLKFDVPVIHELDSYGSDSDAETDDD